MPKDPASGPGRFPSFLTGSVGWWTGFWPDALVVLVLLTLAITPFIEAIWQPGHVPFGLDMAQHYAREAFNRVAFNEAWVPLWNPYEFSGFPAQADPQTGVFYPPNMLLRLFTVPTFLTWTVVFHVWLFGVGGYVLCRTLGVGRPAAAVAGAALMLGGITTGRMYAGHLDVLRTVAWVPLVLAAAMQSLDRETVRPSAAVVTTLVLVLLSGHLQYVVYTFGAVAFYAAFRAVWPVTGPATWACTRRVAMQFVVLIVLVIGLTAFQLLPTARLVMSVGRTDGVPYRIAIEDRLPLRDVPRAMFLPQRTGEFSEFPQEFWESTAYVGWLPAALAPLGLILGRRQPRVVFLILLGALALGLAMGGPLYRLHHLVFPMFRIPGRLLCFWAIVVTALGAFALDWLTRRRADEKPLSRLTWRNAVLPLAVGVVVIVDGVGYARHFVRVRPLEERFSSSLPFTPSPHGRVLSLCEDRLSTSEISALGVPSIDGYNTYFFDSYAQVARKARGDEVSEPSIGFPRIAQRELVDVAVASALNVTDIVSCEPVTFPGLVLVGEREGLHLYKNTGATGRAALRCGNDARALAEWAATCGDQNATIRVLVADTPTGVLRLRVSLPGARTLVLAEPFYAERRAWVDGAETPIEKANIALSAVRLGAGVHVVELKYVPTSLVLGALISFVVLVLWIAAEALRRRRSSHGVLEPCQS